MTDDRYVGRCPVCAEPADYCRGHGPIGDPTGAAILVAHARDNHERCHPDGCDERAAIDETETRPDSVTFSFTLDGVGNAAFGETPADAADAVAILLEQHVTGSNRLAYALTDWFARHLETEQTVVDRNGNAVGGWKVGE